MLGRPKRECAAPGRSRVMSRIANLVPTPAKATASRSQSISQLVEGSDIDSQPEILNSSQQLELLCSPSSSQFQTLLDGQMELLRELRTDMKDLKESKTQVTDEIRSDLRHFCAELQQTFEKQMRLEVERKVSEKIAPLQEELAAVKIEMQQMRERMESSPTSTSQPQTQPNVSQLEDKLHRLEQVTVQQATQTDQAARQLRAKNAVLRNFQQADNESPATLKTAVSRFVRKDRMQTDAVVSKATRFENKGKGAVSTGMVIVEFATVADKRKVFKARGKLAGCNVGLDDDLTPLQQKQRSAAWAKFQEARAQGLRTRWEAEKLYIKEGEEWVMHRVCSTC